MSSIFTVAVDLSKIKKAPPFIFQVLVDPTQMSSLIEFIELVRSMFKISDYIRFVHESGCIHYLEDIRILSVLQRVQAEIYVPEEAERERMVLLVKMLKFYDKSQSFPKILLNRLRVNFNNQTGEIVAADDKQIQDKKSREESLNTSQSNLNLSFKENSPKEKEITSQIQLLAIEPKKPLESVQFHTDDKKSCSYENPKQMNISEVDNITRNQRRKSNSQRPFSLGTMLTQLRNEASTSDNFPKEEFLSNNQNHFNCTVENEEDGEDEEEISNNETVNKKRKRVRKHKSKKRKRNDNILPNSNSTPNGTFEFMEDDLDWSDYVPNKIKHVRFVDNGADEEELPKVDDPQVENGTITVDQIFQELQQKKELLENGQGISNNCEKGNNNSITRVEDIGNSEATIKTPNVRLLSCSTLPPELNELLTFKKKNLSPIVYKRFEDLGLK